MEMTKKFGLRVKVLRVICAIAILSLLAPSGIALAGGVAMAPPVDSAYAAPAPAGDSVFEWNEVPENQEVPIKRAVFDRDGYQLYDSVGETIVVPFARHDLYVMKFAVSPNDTMYFVNTGAAPVLYCPRDAYLENAAVVGARWYPFSEHFHPVTPVYEGCAPSYTVFVDEGWYPDEDCYGGYWCNRPFFSAGFFLATIGLFFVIGDHHCFGFHDFDDFCHVHPWFHHEGFFRPAVWGYGARSSAWRGRFDGTVHDLRASGFAGRARGFNGAGQAFHGAAAFRAQRNGWNGQGAFHGYGRGIQNAQGFRGNGGGRNAQSWRGNGGARNAQGFHGNAGARNAQGFRGNAGARNAQSFRGNAGIRNAQGFRGGNNAAQRGGRGFQGARSFGARSASNGGRSFQGARRTFSAHHLTPGGRSFGGGGRSFGGGNRSSGGARSFGGGGRSFGGNARSFGGGNRSFGGGGGRSFGGGGGGRSFSGGGGGRSFGGGGGGRSFGGGGGGGHAFGGGGGGRGGGGHGGGNRQHG